MEKFNTQDIACMRECFAREFNFENEVECCRSFDINFCESERSELERYHD